MFAACGFDTGSSEAPQLSLGAPAIVDRAGLHWQLQHERVAFAELSGEPASVSSGEPASVSSDPRAERGARLASLTRDELAARMSPRMLIGGSEYRLEQTDRSRFAGDLQRALSDPRERSAPSSLAAAGPREVPREPQPTALALRFDTIDNDQRENASDVAADWPYNMIGAQTVGNVCTVSKLINHHTAVTAAHCVHNGSDWLKPHALQFGAGGTGPWQPLEAGCYVATIPEGWDENRDVAFDFAVLALGGREGTSCNFADYDTGFFGFRTVGDCVADVAVSLYGFPVHDDSEGDTPPGDWTYPTLFGSHSGDGYTTCVVFPETLWFYNDASEGQSGSPVFSSSDDFEEHTLRAIYKGGYDGVMGHINRGRKIDSGLITFFETFGGY